MKYGDVPLRWCWSIDRAGKCAALVVGVMLVAGCGDKGGRGKKAPPAKASSPDAAPTPADASAPTAKRRDAGPGAGMAVKGPTGIPECDAWMSYVCGCVDKQPSLRLSCKNLRAGAPGWRAKAEKNDPAVISETRDACRRSLKATRAAFSCK